MATAKEAVRRAGGGGVIHIGAVVLPDPRYAHDWPPFRRGAA